MLLLFAAALSVCFCYTQESGADGTQILADRPGFGDAVSVIQKNGIQVESGFCYERERIGKPVQEGMSLNTGLFRYGLASRMELRMDYNIWHSSNQDSSFTSTGLYPIRLGGKFRITENRGKLPAITFIGMQELAFTASKVFRPEKAATEIQLSFANEITERFSICYNLGAMLRAKNSYHPLFYYALSLEFSIGKSLGYYAQLHGSVQEISQSAGKYDVQQLLYTEAGLMYYPARSVQLDFSGGLKIFDYNGDRSAGNVGDTYWFITAGVSWKINR